MLLILIIIIILKLSNTNKAIIISTSIGFYNYRQTANALIIYHHLKEFGFIDSDILLQIPQNSGCCEKNPKYGTISFIDNEYDNINDDLQIDYRYSSMSMNVMFNVLRHKYPNYELNKIKLHPKLNDILYIYLTGHGGDYYLKIRQREALIQDQFKLIFHDLHIRHIYDSILLMSDSCSAVTPFETVDIPNFIAIGSSSLDQKSLSHGFDHNLNIAKSDDFTYYLHQYLKEKVLNLYQVTIKEVMKFLDWNKLKVHAKCVGKDKNKQSNKYLNKYMINKSKIIRKRIHLI